MISETSRIADSVIDLPNGEVALYVSARAEEVGDRLQAVLTEAGRHVLQPYPHVWSVVGSADRLRPALAAIDAKMTAAELDQISFHLTPLGVEPTPSQLMQSRKIRELIAWSEGQWVGDLIASDKLTTHFQPIVVNAHPNQVFAYECLLRAVDRHGQLIRPDRLINAARHSRRLERLDHAARITAIETAAQRDIQTCVFVNFNPRFLEDSPDSWAQTLAAAIGSGIDPSRFVFEVIESDEIQDLPRLLDILDSCREAGCRVALDDLGTGYNSLQLMSHVRPDFIKLDMELIRNVDRDAYKSCVAGKILELARELDVYTVVEGVETRAEWEWSKEHGADFAQGYLFARPAADPPLPNIDFSADIVAESQGV